MNLSLSKRADYVVKAAMALARAYDGDSYLKIREVTAEMAIPRSYTPQILDALVQKGLVESRAGKAGGYRLVRSPEQISVLQVVEAGEGSLRPERCALSDGPCRWESVCPMHEVMSSAVNKFRETMANQMLSELAERDMLLEKGELPAPEDPHLRGNPFREFGVRHEIGISLDIADIVALLQQDAGDWLAPLLIRAIENSIYEESLTKLFPENHYTNARLSVALGYFRRQGDHVTIPVTIEPDKSSYEVPQFIASISLAGVSASETRCEVVGRFIFDSGIVAVAEISGAESLAVFHSRLSQLSGRIVANFLTDFAHKVIIRSGAMSNTQIQLRGDE